MEIRTMSAQDYNGQPNPGSLELPADSMVIGAFRGHSIVGRTVLLNMLHLEGTWIEPSARNGMVGARLIRTAEKEAKAIGCRTLMAYTAESKHGEYMARLGYKKIPVEVWGKEL